LYRSGQMTAGGMRTAIERYGIKTVVNLQHEEPDPLMPERWLAKGTVRESELCRSLGVRYVLITPDLLPPGNTVEMEPPAVSEWLDLLDDESNYPVLLHCKAGLHRTGRLTAIYRMEYHGWSPGEALRELRANGYGYVNASERDEYVIQFIQNYKPRGKTVRATTRAAALIAGGAQGAGGRP
jgi:tyrosine-protein phosphatase SIW14